MFSIIITAYNTKDFIEQCLESIENQTFFKNNNDYEILIGVDNCFETLEKIQQIRKKFRNIKVFFMNKNYGTYITTNTLLTLVKFENIIRFDSDDIMFNNLIEILSNNLKFDIIRYRFEEFKNNDLKNSKISKSFALGVLFYKKKIFEKLGGYQDWICAADSELEKRYTIAKFNILKIDKPLFYYRIHENSLTNSKLTGYRSQIRKEFEKKIQAINENYPIFVQPKIGEFKEIV